MSTSSPADSISSAGGTESFSPGGSGLPQLSSSGMDLYRYFHPHHNPRLRKTPLRLIELGELQQATVELKNALQSAFLRATNSPTTAVTPENVGQLLVALDYVIESLGTMGQHHPEDSIESLHEMLRERKNAPGWENWSTLLQERLLLLEEQNLRRAPVAVATK